MRGERWPLSRLLGIAPTRLLKPTHDFGPAPLAESPDGLHAAADLGGRLGFGEALAIRVVAQLGHSPLRIGEAGDDLPQELAIGLAAFLRSPKLPRHFPEVSGRAKGCLAFGLGDCGELPLIVLATERRNGRIGAVVAPENDKLERLAVEAEEKGSLWLG